MSEEFYLKWAQEFVDVILEDIYDPYLASHSDWVVKRVAEKLKEDLPVVVEEGFCSDCDYHRRYGQ